MRKKHIVGVIDQASIRTTVRTDKNKVTIGSDNYETASIAYTGELLPTGTKSYGSDIINTSFDSSAGWVVNAGWSVSGGKANMSNSGVASYLTFSSFSPTIGKSYEVTFTVSNYVTGTSRFTCAGVNGQAITANGTYTEIFVALSAVQFSLYGGTTAVCSFDNVIVKEVLINPNLRYLKNSGKDKTPALVESGQGKFFNGTSQYLNTSIIPNQAEGTLVTRFTYVTGMVNRRAVGAYDSYRLLLGVSSSGKIGAGIGNTTDTVAYWDAIPINGYSYHVALKYIGNLYYLYVNGMKVKEGSFTGNIPNIAMYLGALNSGGVATTYFNNVIDETYYYNVALADAQIETLAKYPEKVKTYNGAIVPDIGSEANCKLFLPMCENSGSNVVNVAVARGGDLVVNGGFDSDTAWTKSTGWTINGGKLIGSSPASGNQTYQALSGVSIGATVMIEYEITAYTSGTIRPMFGTLGGTSKSALGKYNDIGVLTGSTNIGIQSFGTAFVGEIDNIKVTPITAYPLASYATTMHTSAAKLSYGAQCTAWKRDSLGVLLGMSNGLSFDGGVSINKVNTAWIPLSTENFVVEAVIYSKSGLPVNQNIGAKNFRWNINTAGNGFGLYASSWRTTVSVVANQWHHVVVEVNGTTVKRYVDGVLLETLTGVTWTSDITAYFIGDDGFGGVAFRTIIGTPKIHKGTQYAKFNIAKAWAKAQKTIAKLGA